MNDDDLLPSSNPIAQKRSSRTNTSSSNEILKAYQVDAYKYVNKKYENRGKVGLALLGSRISNNFNLLLYGKANSHITQANINSEFMITSTEELYVSFYDIKSENWSLRFDSFELFNDFLSRMCIYKIISSNKSDLVVIDVKTGNGPKVQETDLCEIELSVNSIRNNEISSILFSSDNQETLRTHVGSNKLMIAVEKGLIGMSKGGFRVIGVPCKSPYIKGGSITIPAETNILIYIKLIRTKTKVEKPTVKPDDAAAEVELPLPDLNFDQQYKSDELSDKSKKLDLLSRMAILGRPIPAYNAENSNSDIHTKNISHNSTIPITTHEMGITHQALPISYNNLFDTSMLNKQLLPVHAMNQPFTSVQQIYPQVPNQPASTDFSVLFTETRQNNTEMRVAMSKLQDKIDKILDKIDTKTSNVQQTLTRHMDAENVFENIKRIINENENLKLENTQKSEIIEKQNKRINEMLRNSQFILSESHDVIQRNSASFNSSATEQQNRILQLEEEKLNLIRNLSQKTGEVSQLEQKLEEASANAQSYRVKSLEYNEQMTKLSDEIGDLKLKNRSLTTEFNDLKAVHNSNSKIQEELQSRQKQWVEEENALQKQIENLKIKNTQFNSKINEIQSNCEMEISDARQQCHHEVEEWKNKLKAERQRINNKNTDLLTEIEQINQDWERRFEDYRQNESIKSTKIAERNRELMVENANINRDLIQLKQQLAMSGDVKSSLENELITKNQTLSQELNELQMKLLELTELKTKNGYLQTEVANLREDNMKSKEIRLDYELLKNKNEELQFKLTEIQKENENLATMKIDNSTKNDSSVPNVEMKIKKIMNDVFKGIKNDFNMESNYSGKEVINICMTIIRDMTLLHISGENKVDNDDEEDESDEESSTSTDREIEVNEIEIDQTIEQAVIEITDKDKSQTEETIDETIQTISENTPPELNSFLPEIELNDNKSELNETSEDIGNSFDEKHEEKILTSLDHENHHHTDSDSIRNEDSIQIPLDYENRNQIDSETVVNEDTSPIPLDPENEIQDKTMENEINSQISLDGENSNQFESYVLVNQPISLFPPEIINNDIDDLSKSEPLEEQHIVSAEPPKTDELLDVPEKIVSNNTDLLKDPENNSKKDTVLSSDEDDDVLEFFEKLTKKTKPRESETKAEKPNVVSSDNDDLSWLND